MSEWIKKDDNPFKVFKEWFNLAGKADNFEPTALTLATVDESGMPSARVVLLKQFDDNGLCFFTNYDSEKGQELDKHPKAAMVFHWPLPLHRQIRVRGTIEKLPYEHSNAYFQTRPRGSRIGAWASPQSQEISSREELEKQVKAMEERFSEDSIPCPENWGGYRLQPLSFEFWQAQDFRLHDRIKFTRSSLQDDWQAKRLAP